MGDETRELLLDGFSAWGIPFTEHQIDQLLAYRDLLVEWNANRMNLTRLISPRDIAVEHFLDSVSLLTVLDIARGASLLDIGAGAGFPSLPLKILRPDLKVTLLEATAKKLTFCRALAEQLGLKEVRLVHGRAEQPPKGVGLRSFDIVTARAVSHMDKLASWCEPYMKIPRGVFAAYKGARAEEETAEAEAVLRGLRLSPTIKIAIVPGSDKVHEIVLCRRAALDKRKADRLFPEIS